ncbi:uncharacterized protein LOC112494619 [Cephus cinctus]|uniref:Uncharacterized protein LOC112494619 n=1 Tax=Cephus cinctus TaxID=211228 RepID=A0AAJ7RKJ9_CEPCN|nr:uncharacterized protein LOC112494619 [Cephus cinctus]
MAEEQGKVLLPCPPLGEESTPLNASGEDNAPETAVPGIPASHRRRAQAWGPMPAIATSHRPAAVRTHAPVSDDTRHRLSVKPGPSRGTPGTTRRRVQPLREEFTSSDEDRFTRRRRRFLSPHRVLQEVRRWGLSFSGRPEEDVEDFISIVEEGRAMVPVQDEDLIRTLSFCLTGVARTWYREASALLPDWPAAKAALRERFSDPDYQIALREEISRRTQGERESALEYLGCMNGLFSRLSPPWTDGERVRYAHRNMLPTYRLVIPLHDRLTMRDLERTAARQEQILRSVGTRRPPPGPEASLCPGFACRDSPAPRRFSRRTNLRAVNDLDVASDDQLSTGEENPAHDLLEAVLPPRQQRARTIGGKPPGPSGSRTVPRKEPISTSSRTNHARRDATAEKPLLPERETTTAPAPDQRAFDCWNCRQSGHRHRECPEPRRLFCYRCGLSGVSTARCTFCNQGNAQKGA